MRSLVAIALVAACGSPPRPSPRPPGPAEPPTTTDSAPANEIRCSEAPGGIAIVALHGTTHGDVCKTISSKAGVPLDEKLVDQDVVYLYKTGFFDDVIAVTEQRGDKTVLVYELRDRAVITRIDVVGGPPGITLPTHAPDGLADPVLIRRNAAAMEEALRDAGYRKATVEHRTSPTDKGPALTYTINAGPRTVLGEVKFKGLDAKREAAIRKDLASQLGQPVLDDATQRDTITVQTALYEEGLLTSRLSHDLVDAGEAKVDLVFTIVEGPVFKLGVTKVKGPRAKDAKMYAKALAPLKKGAVARRSVLVAAVKAIEAIHASDQPVPIVIPQSNVQIDKKLVDFDFVVE